MSQKSHLLRAVKILRNRFQAEMIEEIDWTWNLKNWTLNFLTSEDYESVYAYKVKDNVTQWNDEIILEKKRKVWIYEV